jgi:MSHA biogenesis protein MshP
MSTTCPDRQRGFGVIAAIVILVILAGLAGFIVSISTTQSITFAQDVQGARAYQAARAGVEWGIAKWLAAAPDCPDPEVEEQVGATGAFDGGFTVKVKRKKTPGTPSFCTIESTATTGSPGSIGYIERQLRAVVEGN